MPRRKKLKGGDLIEIFCPAYQHWAIYVGCGDVIHLSPPYGEACAKSSSVVSVLCDWAVVKKEKLSDVVGNDYYKVSNLLDDEYKPRDINLILKEAHSLVGRMLLYNIFSNNCEHFVTDLRYGKPTSRQAQQAVISGIAVLGVVGLLALTMGLISKTEERKEKKNFFFF